MRPWTAGQKRFSFRIPQMAQGTGALLIHYGIPITAFPIKMAESASSVVRLREKPCKNGPPRDYKLENPRKIR
jgi:hypothetical protein